MEIALRYIVFFIDSKYSEHDGKIFTELKETREWCKDAIESQYADKIVIGQFEARAALNFKTAFISMIETYGFRNKKKNYIQLELFK